MQLQLPIFPIDIKLITPQLGLRREKGMVYYFLSGLPIYSHEDNDMESFRLIVCQLVVNGLCKRSQIADTLGLPRSTVNNYLKRYLENGISGVLEPKRPGSKAS